VISNQILQNVVEGLKPITKKEIRILERDGRLLVGERPTNLEPDIARVVETFVYSLAETQSLKGWQYFKVFDNGIAEYIVMIQGDDEETYQLGKMVAFHVHSLLVAYKERFDRDNFVKNLLMDNLLLVDIYNRAKRLQIESSIRRVVFLIEMELDREMTSLEVIRNIFPAKQRDFVTAIDNNHIVLVKELRDKDTLDDIERYAYSVIDTLAAEAMNRSRIAIGTPITDLKYVSASYKEARMALEAGEIFENEKIVINYETLGIARLIYQLPPSICRLFINEVIQGMSIENFDEELLTTVTQFFNSHLNVSETARQLYIHRNTLVYRLDKLQKMTGLDLRNFDDALLFKLTLMVSKYIAYKDRNLP